MPLGWERINVKRTPPNKNIVFIKPLPGPDVKTAEEFLERIAAQCLPIMNRNHLAVVSLEEYEPNLEFWGRNFNNGEVIQLVLRSPSTGHWLPFKFVQMVMMHELAHNKQMNHSKHFWAVRNQFSSEMKSLWEKSYTGEGLWGRGVLLQNGAFAREELEEGEVLPKHLCGGGFRSRGKKRKLKPRITYKEQKERRERKIKAKFGSGTTVGADEQIRSKLEYGKKLAGKPRVASSARGRELRAAAALARFEMKKGEEPEKNDNDLVTDSEAEDGDEDETAIKSEPGDAVDNNGEPLLDNQGRNMVKVCDEEDNNDEDAKQELLELQNMKNIDIRNRLSHPSLLNHPKPDSIPRPRPKPDEEEIMKLPRESRSDQLVTQPGSITKGRISKANDDESQRTSVLSCPVCSVENESVALTCLVCSNVLQPQAIPNSWQCDNSICRHSRYINAGDVGLCGVCGTKKYSN